MIPGFHGVQEALTHDPFRVNALWIAEGKKSARTEEIIRMAQERKVPIRFKKNTELSHLLPDTAHQGMVALAEPFAYSDLNHLIDMSLRNKNQALLIAADHSTLPDRPHGKSFPKPRPLTRRSPATATTGA